MSFEKEYVVNNLWDQFQFYKGATTGERIFESIDEAVPKVFMELRFHAASAVGSAETLRLYVSAAKGSQFNYTIISHPLSGSTDYRFIASDKKGFLLQADDHLVLSVNISNTTIMGVVIEGWSVSGG